MFLKTNINPAYYILAVSAILSERISLKYAVCPGHQTLFIVKLVSTMKPIVQILRYPTTMNLYVSPLRAVTTE